MSKKSISVMLVFALIVSIAPVFNLTALADAGDYLSFRISNGEATVTKFNLEVYAEYYGDGVVEIPSFVYSSGSEEGIPVTGIADGVFKGCTDITEVKLSSNLKTIGSEAFALDSGLTAITLPDTVTSVGQGAFRECTNLVSANIPDGVQAIENYTFSFCTSLEEIVIPDSVKTIGDGAFLNCESLKKLTLGSGVESIGKNAFKFASITSLDVPDSCKAIGDEAFYECSFLAELDLGGGLVTIGDESFANCSELTLLTIPDTVEAIGAGAFSNCDGLMQMQISKNLRTLGSRAFYYCSGLTEVYLYDKLESIGTSAFGLCGALQNICVESGNQHYSATDGNLFNKSKTSFIQYAIGKSDTAYSIPEGVTAIEPWAFYRAKRLEEINLPSSLNTIGNNAFYQCERLKYLYIPAGVASIGAECFSDCYKLAAIDVSPSNDTYASDEGVLYNKSKTTLICYPGGKECESFIVPSYVDTIAESGMAGNNKLKRVIVSEGVVEIGQWAFFGCGSLTDIHLPSTVRTVGPAVFEFTAVESIIIPEGVTTLQQTFSGCDSLKTIVLPESLTEIGYLTFPDSMQDVTIYYRGSEEEWSNITVDMYNGGLESCTIIYSFTDKNNIAPSISGCQLAGDMLNVSVDYAHNVSGSIALIGIYDGNKLLSVGMQYVSAGSAESEFSVPADSSYVGKTVKVLFWDDPNSMNNVGEVLSGTITE